MSEEATEEKFDQIPTDQEASEEPIRTQPVSDLNITSSTEQVTVVPEVLVQRQYVGMTVIP